MKNSCKILLTFSCKTNASYEMIIFCLFTKHYQKAILREKTLFPPAPHRVGKNPVLPTVFLFCESLLSHGTLNWHFWLPNLWVPPPNNKQVSETIWVSYNFTIYSEIHSTRSGRILSTGASVPMQLGCIIFLVWMHLPAWRLSESRTIGILWRLPRVGMIYY